MHWAVLLAASAALAGAHLLRFPRASGPVFASTAFLCGLVLMSLVVRNSTEALGFGRVTDFDRIVNRAVEIAKQDPAPLMLFTGASYSRNAIDDARLTVALRAEGLPHRVINLSLEAASLEERNAHLAAFMKQSGRVPAVVFVEIAESIDYRPALTAMDNPFSHRSIEHYDVVTAWQEAKGLEDSNCRGLLRCAQARVLLGGHAVLNLLNVGLLSAGDVEAGADGLSAYDPRSNPRQGLTAEDRSDGLSLTIGARSISGPGWIVDQRTRQRRELNRIGVATIGYYLPPVIDPGARAYAASLCAGELRAMPCIPPDDPNLLAALNKPVWLDESHLLVDGAGVYARWLAERIALEMDAARKVAVTPTGETFPLLLRRMQ